MNGRRPQQPDRADQLLGKLAVGEITPEERHELNRIAENRHGIRERIDQESHLIEGVRAARGDAFPPGFSQRVLDRVRPREEESGIADTFISRLFARFAPVAIGLTVIVGIYNATTTNADSPVDAVLGIESVTVADAYGDALTKW